MSASKRRPIRILYVCSFWSGHSRALVEYFSRRPDEFELTVLSSDPAAPMPGVRLLAPSGGPGAVSKLVSWLAERWMARIPVPEWLWRRVTAVRFAQRTRALRARVLAAVDGEPPDIIHALRTQPEGLAAAALKERFPNVPFALWIWGLDFVLVAEESRALFQATQDAVRRVDLLLPDNPRDAVLAHERFGLSMNARVVVLPVTGGLEPDELDGASDERPVELTGEPILLCMRAYENAYVRIRVLIEALVSFRKRHPRARPYLLAAQQTADLARDRLLLRWAEDLGVADAVEVLHPTRSHLFSLLRHADLYVSATRADGMPVSLLEALYFGMIPVVFDHASTRELLATIGDGVSFDRIDAQTIADAWERAVVRVENRAERTRRNRAFLRDGWLRSENLEALAGIYRELAGRSSTNQ